jgi:cation transport ATPase
VLTRPLEQRTREHKYRFAQTVVFGFPVIGLQYFGERLGGSESARAVAIIQFVLSGWILAIGATGMLSEGVMLLIARRRISGDFLVGACAVILFAFSCISSAALFFRTSAGPRLFHVVVIVLAVWSAIQWSRSQLALILVRSTTRESGSAAKSEA